MKFSNKFLVLFALLAMVLTLVPAISAQEEVSSVCLVTDVGRVNDNGFNQLAHEGAEAAAADYELDYDYIETVSEADYAANLQTCVDSGADIVVTVGFLIQDATAEAAAANPDVYFIGVDQFVVDGPTNFVGLQFREDQSGFLVGVLAALVANVNEADVIAGVYGIDVPAVKRFRNGYEQGALLINPDWVIGENILGTYADSFIDEAQGVSLAQQFIGEGAFVIFGAGGPLGSAAIREAASQGVYVIGVDRDEYYGAFGSGETEGAEFLISSALKNVDEGVYNAISFLGEGDFETWAEYGGSNYLLDAEEGGVGFAEGHDSDVPVEIYEGVDVIFQLLTAGCLSTNVDPVSGDLLSAEDAAAFVPAEGCEELATELMGSMEATEAP
jgi:basic membrane lipoprotein Med (substrate-binding protein (PBP1-ABC) superfamily)